MMKHSNLLEFLKTHTLFWLVFSTLFFAGIYVLMEYMIHFNHEISVFFSFFFLPAIYLFYRTMKYGEPLRWGNIDMGFMEGIVIYLIFAGYILLYYPSHPEFFKGYQRNGFSLLFRFFLMALNVASVDFFTKRFIQYPIKEMYGSVISLCVQTGIWLIAHYPESLWLKDLMGEIGSWVFLAFTGILTGISYNRTENVSGQMAGHVILNLIIVGVVNVL